MFAFLKSIIPLRWRLQIRSAIGTVLTPKDFPTQSPRLIVVLGADYANLGDVALTHALLKYCAHELPKHQPYILTAGRFFFDIRAVSRAVTPDDVVVIVGGGNIGDLYPYLEEARLIAVKKFQKNRIISFPQSMSFSDTVSGKRALRRSASVYANHPNLILFAREKVSYKLMKDAFPNVRIGIAPDTVFSLKQPVCNQERDIPLLICLRTDIEAMISPSERAAIHESLSAKYPKSVNFDTLSKNKESSYLKYEEELMLLLAKFKRSKCVVTDRLHGLIFSVITDTPCVVIENNNHKIRATVESWLPNSNSVKLLSRPSAGDIICAVESLTLPGHNQDHVVYDFSELAAAIRGNVPR